MDDLVQVLTKFHRDILGPDVERIVTASEHRLRDEMNGRFDEIYHRFERLETEYHPTACRSSFGRWKLGSTRSGS